MCRLENVPGILRIRARRVDELQERGGKVTLQQLRNRGNRGGAKDSLSFSFCMEGPEDG